MAIPAPRGINLISKTTTGAPSSGTWAVGDLAQDSAGTLYRCTVAGTPGTWVEVGAASAAGDFVANLVNAEVSVSTTTTLTSSAFGKLHVLSGSAFTVTLPTASGNAGKLIGFRVDDYATANVQYTIDGNSTEDIDQQQTIKVSAGRTVVLMARSDSSFIGWAVVQDTGARAVLVEASSDAGQVITSATDLQYEDETIDTHSAWATNTFTAPLDGVYLIQAFVYTTTTGVSAMTIIKNGSTVIVGATYTNDRYQVNAAIRLNAADTVKLRLARSATRNAGQGNILLITRIGDLT